MYSDEGIEKLIEDVKLFLGLAKDSNITVGEIEYLLENRKKLNDRVIALLESQSSCDHAMIYDSQEMIENKTIEQFLTWLEPIRGRENNS